MLEILTQRSKASKITAQKDGLNFYNSVFIASSKLFRLKTLNLADNNLKAFEVDFNLKPKKLEKVQTKIQ